MSIFLLLLYNNKTVCKLLILNVCGICFDVLYVNKMHAETQAELITALSLSTHSHTTHPPIESGRYINWFSSIFRVVTFFNEPIEKK